jgi:signal peptidase I
MHESRRAAAEPLPDGTQRAGDVVQSPISSGRWAWEWTKSFLIAVAIFLVIRTFLVEPFRIPTGSMEKTLLVGDFLLVNKAVFGAGIPFSRSRVHGLAEPVRGTVVVFVPPHDPDRNYVKRLVGVPGDTLEMHGKSLYINGRPQEEPYVSVSDPRDTYASGMFWQCEYAPAARTHGECRPTRDNWGPLVVPRDRYFLLGDNRDDSEDSRYWGFVPPDAIRGRPIVIYYSFDPTASRRVPWLTAIRWNRIARRVH